MFPPLLHTNTQIIPATPSPESTTLHSLLYVLLTHEREQRRQDKQTWESQIVLPRGHRVSFDSRFWIVDNVGVDVTRSATPFRCCSRCSGGEMFAVIIINRRADVTVDFSVPQLQLPRDDNNTSGLVGQRRVGNHLKWLLGFSHRQ